MKQHTTKCEYEFCLCEVEAPMRGAAYCSDACESRDNVEEEMEDACVCGHPACDTP